MLPNPTTRVPPRGTLLHRRSQRGFSFFGVQHVILVVDDNEDAADSLADVLRHAGHQVNVAYNGMCALARVRTCHPDVRRCLEAGFDAHLAKPAQPEEIQRLLS